MSVYFMRGIISSEGNRIITRGGEDTYIIHVVYRGSTFFNECTYYVADFCLLSRQNTQMHCFRFFYVDYHDITRDSKRILFISIKIATRYRLRNFNL